MFSFYIIFFLISPVECSDSNLFGNEGSIKSPRYPNNYPHHLQCRWVIKAPKQKQIVIRFEYFDLEGASKCRFDYVAVRDGEKENSPVIGIYCGFSKPATITTSNNVASIRFNSDTSISGGGFLIRWNTIDYMVQPTTIGPTLAGKQHLHFAVRYIILRCCVVLCTCVVLYCVVLCCVVLCCVVLCCVRLC